MKQPDLQALIWDALDASRSAREFVGDRTFEQFEASKVTVAATERMLEIVGEALHHAELADPAIAAKISDFRLIVDFRNRLAHGYFDVDAGRAAVHSRIKSAPE